MTCNERFVCVVIITMMPNNTIIMMTIGNDAVKNPWDGVSKEWTCIKWLMSRLRRPSLNLDQRMAVKRMNMGGRFSV